MKRLSLFVLAVFVLCGCSGKNQEIDGAIAFRQKLLNANQCSFDADVTANYGDKLYTFSVECTVDGQGSLDFTITKPETISGITGRIEQGEGQLLFDDVALAFPLLAEGELSPVSSPWIFMNTLRSGYLKSVGREEQLYRLTMDDSYREDALQVDIWTSTEYIPVRAEILHNGNRILSMDVIDFQIL